VAKIIEEMNKADEIKLLFTDISSLFRFSLALIRLCGPISATSQVCRSLASLKRMLEIMLHELINLTKSYAVNESLHRSFSHFSRHVTCRLSANYRRRPSDYFFIVVTSS
jgi:hypothetical protein